MTADTNVANAFRVITDSNFTDSAGYKTAIDNFVNLAYGGYKTIGSTGATGYAGQDWTYLIHQGARQG